MATWLEKLRKIDTRNKEQEKLAREMTHRPQADIESLRGQDPLTDWGLGVRERTLNPLSTLAGEAKRFQGLSPQEMGMELVGGGIAGTFIGKGAKTWKAAMKDTAEKMEKQGVPPEEIWKQTGTFRGADKEWRQEIPDDASKFLKSSTQAFNKYGARTQESVFEHPELYSAYPDVGKTAVMRSGKLDYSGVQYPERDYIELGLPRKSPDLGRARDVNLHELQHAIQQREGWARGGSPEGMAAEIPLNELDLNSAQLIQRRIARGDTPSEAARWLKETLGHDVSPQIMDQAMKPDVLLSPFDKYKRLAGEAEARLTQARMNMTSEQRLNSYPPSMFDIPMENQIVRRDAGTAMSIPAIDFKPESSFLSAKSDAGLVGGHIRDGGLYISHAEVDPTMRGKGEGVKLYQALIDDAQAKGLKVYSDSTVEAEAARMYDALKRRGYDVQNQVAGTLEGGAVYGKGAKEPAFYINNLNSLK